MEGRYYHGMRGPGGRGRAQDASPHRHPAKVMLPLANRPILEHLLAAGRDAGIRDFVVVVGYREKEIRDHFGDGSGLGIRIRYVPQRQPAGHRRRPPGNRRARLRHVPAPERGYDRPGRRPEGVPPVPPAGHGPLPLPPAPGLRHRLLEGDRVTGLDEKSRTPRSDLINAGAYLLDGGIFDALGSLSRSPAGSTS